MSTRFARCVSLTIVLATGVSCDRGMSTTEYRRIEAWLTCDECWNAERGLVRAIGTRAVPRLADALRNGPSSDRQDIMRRQFAAGYSASPDITQADYAEALLRNLVASYQIRAATSLADIGGNDARRVLQDAFNDSLVLKHRTDVTQAIRVARGRVDANAFRGRVLNRIVNFGDTVRVAPPAGTSFTGTERAAIHDGPFGAEDIHLATTPSELAFRAVGPVGERFFTITNARGSSTSGMSMFAVRSLRDAGDRLIGACGLSAFACHVSTAPSALPVGGQPFVFYFVLQGGSVRDTMNIFRIEPTSNATFSITFDWRPIVPSGPPGPLVTFGMTPCGSYGHGVGSFGPVSNPFQMNVSLTTNQCRLLVARIGPPATQPIFARLRVTTQVGVVP